MADNSKALTEYKEAVSDLAEARWRVKALETRVAQLEHEIGLIAAGTGSTKEPRREYGGESLSPRFERLIQIIQDLGGRAKLRDIAKKTKLTSTGTLMQIRQLEKRGIVRKYDRGVYELVK